MSQRKSSKRSDKSKDSDISSIHTSNEPTSPKPRSKKTPAAEYAERAGDGSPVSVLFATSSGDPNEIIIRSSDSYDFYINRFILKVGSPVLGSMMAQQPAPPPKTDEESPSPPSVMMLPETAPILDVLFTLLYPVEPPTWTSLEGFGPVIDAAIRYDMRGPIETLRQALICPRRVDDSILPSFAELDPLRVYAIARQAGLEPEAQISGNATKSISLRNSEMSAEVENMPTKYYRELISLRDEKGHWKETFKLFKAKGVSLKRTSTGLTGLGRMGSTRSMGPPSFMLRQKA
ncbi:hypothetical protein M408DRAFT_328508 [Serendipita vermifera MAFF 305830]|uniref:BTB domain-containing protein n=1 Tax=Serendipita vermifera MAFF 305830 TaxID=933852 RepID=A0A0C3B034_SERVB|nr:hypothetical protein M408DRAFT_328508 [Serendipita vermifera MAFF 305830]